MIIGDGAEATIERTETGVRKTRPVKAYRHPDLDLSLRRFRTRREAKVLQRLPVPGPRLLLVDDRTMVVEMEFLEGAQLRDVLCEDNAERYGRELGVIVRALHDGNIVHGDLTTSNVLVVDEALRLIDFGLSVFSDKVEDKAVDLHLLKESLSAKHPLLSLWDHVVAGYGEGVVWERLVAVEKRGRYKQKGS